MFPVAVTVEEAVTAPVTPNVDSIDIAPLNVPPDAFDTVSATVNTSYTITSRISLAAKDARLFIVFAVFVS